MKEWLARFHASKAGPWLLMLACCLLALALQALPTAASNEKMTEEETRISCTLSRIAGAGETRVSIYYAPDVSAFGSGKTPIGAVIVAQGAGEIDVRMNLMLAAETLLGLHGGQVEVFAMEETP